MPTSKIGLLKGMPSENTRRCGTNAPLLRTQWMIQLLFVWTWIAGVTANDPAMPPGSSLVTFVVAGPDVLSEPSLGMDIQLAVSAQIDSLRIQDVWVVSVSPYCPPPEPPMGPAAAPAAPAPSGNRRLLSSSSSSPYFSPAGPSQLPGLPSMVRSSSLDHQQSVTPWAEAHTAGSPLPGPLPGAGADAGLRAVRADANGWGSGPLELREDMDGTQSYLDGLVIGGGDAESSVAGQEEYWGAEVARRQLAAALAPGPLSAVLPLAPGVPAPAPDAGCSMAEATMMLVPPEGDPNLRSKVEILIRSGELKAQLVRQKVNVTSVGMLKWTDSGGGVTKAGPDLSDVDTDVAADRLDPFIGSGTAIFILLVIGHDAVEENVELNQIMFQAVTSELNATLIDDGPDYVVINNTRLVQTQQVPGGVSPRDISNLLGLGGGNVGGRRRSLLTLVSERTQARFQRLLLPRSRRAAAARAEELRGDWALPRGRQDRGGGLRVQGVGLRDREEGSPRLLRSGGLRQPIPLLPNGTRLAPKAQHGLWAARLATLGSSAKGAALCLLPTGARHGNTRCRRRGLLQVSSLGPPEKRSDAALVPAPSTSDDAIPALFMKFQITDLPLVSIGLLKQQLLYIVQTNILLDDVQEERQNITAIQLYGFQAGNASIPSLSIPAEAPSGDGSNVPWVVVAAVVPVVAVSLLLGIGLWWYFHRQKRRLAEAHAALKAANSRTGPDSYKTQGGLGENGGYMDSPSLSVATHGGNRLSQEHSGPPDSDRSQLNTVIDNMKERERSLRTDGGQAVLVGIQGLQSDWEIDPLELQILKRADGSEWELGSGAAGRVFKAVRNGVQVVAVKIFTDQLSSAACSVQYAEELRREIFLLRSCHDRNIVQFLGAHIGEGNTILVTEFMENGDLYRCLQHDSTGRFSWYRKLSPSGKPVPGTGMARRVALDIARGLHFLHSKKIVHFDLKSANILLARDWTAKLADVGLSKILKNEYLSTLRAVGTFCWSAPEILMGKPCTEKVDIYSYGVVLWEISVGEAPSGRSLRQLRVPEECPASVEEFINRCLDTDPCKRPSAKELVEFLVDLDPGTEADKHKAENTRPSSKNPPLDITRPSPSASPLATRGDGPAAKLPAAEAAPPPENGGVDDDPGPTRPSPACLSPFASS